jgi:hypothetical protein
MTADRVPRRGTGDRGSATAELAAAMPVLILLLLAGLTAVGAAWTKLQCVDAAREGARAAARGDSGDQAAHNTAPSGAMISVHADGDDIRVTVIARVRLLVPLPTFTVTGTAVAVPERGGMP